MPICFGKDIVDKRIVIRIQKKSPIAKYCDYYGERETMEKVDDL